MPHFEVLDARIASALNRIIHNSHFKRRRSSLEEQKVQKQDRFFCGRQTLITWSMSISGSLELIHDSVENYENTRVWENSRSYWNCMIWKFIRRSEDLIITDWKLWWREVSSRKFETRILAPEMEITRRTPWARIWEQNIVYKEFLEIVGSGKPTGSVWKETIVVSASIWKSVVKSHHQIRLRILSCRRISEKQRESEVQEEGVSMSLQGLPRRNLQ